MRSCTEIGLEASPKHSDTSWGHGLLHRPLALGCNTVITRVGLWLASQTGSRRFCRRTSSQGLGVLAAGLALACGTASWTAPALGMYLGGLLLLVCLEASSLALSQTLRGRDQMTTPCVPAGPPPRVRKRRAWRAVGLDGDCPPPGLPPAAGGLL